jgi:hypothetical protein
VRSRSYEGHGEGFQNGSAERGTIRLSITLLFYNLEFIST